MPEGKKKGAFRAALAHRDYRRLALASVVSQGGDWLYNVALVVFIYERTHSAAWLGGTAFARLLPYVLLGSVGGMLADRFDKKRVMISADVFRACCMVLLAIDAAFIGSPLLAVAIAIANNCASSAFNPSAAALTPRLVGEEDLAAANAVNSTIESGAVVIGPAIGSILVILGTGPLGFALNALTFVVSALTLLTIDAHVPPVKTQSEGGFIHQIADGVRALRQAPTALALLGYEFGVSFLFGTSTVFFILVARSVIHTGSQGFGYLMAAMGLGGVLMAPVATRLLDRSHQILMLAIGPVAGGLGVAALGLTGFLPLALLLAAVFGASNTLVDVIALTLLQRAASPRLVGRIYGVAFTAFLVSILVGTAVEPPLIGLFGLQRAVVFTGLFVAAASLISIPRVVAFEGKLDARRRELAPLADQLQGLRIFEGASRSSIEMLASAMVVVSVPEGTRVIDQGDSADYFYVVREGALEVTRRDTDGSERVVGHLAPGEYFGEIGLLQEGIRTASVIATETTELYSVSGEDFVDAVNRGSDVSVALGDTVARRIASYERRDVQHAPAAATTSELVGAAQP